MIFLDMAAVLCQLVLIYALFVLSGINTRIVLYRYFNPYTFFILFYLLFFIIEQFYYETDQFHFLGQEAFPFALSRDVYNQVQLKLILFLGAIVVGSIFTTPYLRNTPLAEFRRFFHLRTNAAETLILRVYLGVGVAAILYLGRELADMDSFRSALVKSTSGLVATAISFFGNFAYAVLMAQSISRRKYFTAFVLTFIFGAAILYTGARGRFLWPLLISLMIVFSVNNRIPMIKAIFSSFGLLVILSVMDPLKKALTEANASFGFSDIGTSLSLLMEKRNFDGFANFALISTTGSIPPSISYLVTGIRDVFMDTYFPKIYASGVAFGSTIPGYFYLAGGLTGLVILGVLYGVSLGLINILLRNTRERWVIYSIYFALTFYVAVGGDFMESRNKLLTAIAPGPVALLIRYLLNRNRLPARPQQDVQVKYGR